MTNDWPSPIEIATGPGQSLVVRPESFVIRHQFSIISFDRDAGKPAAAMYMS
jgi:hypothetical protein